MLLLNTGTAPNTKLAKQFAMKTFPPPDTSPTFGQFLDPRADKFSGHFLVVHYSSFYSETGFHISIFLSPHPQLISHTDENAGENTRQSGNSGHTTGRNRHDKL